MFPLPEVLALPLCLVSFHSSRITPPGQPSWTSQTLVIFFWLFMGFCVYFPLLGLVTIAIYICWYD